jgi:hypothetical protein
LAADIPPVQPPAPGVRQPAVSAPNSVVILPSEDLSGVPQAESDLASLIAQRMAANGWQVVSNDGLWERLERDRVRYLDSLSQELTKSIANESGATTLLTSTIYVYDDGVSPAVGLSARLVREDGTVLWGDAAVP